MKIKLYTMRMEDSHRKPAGFVAEFEIMPYMILPEIVLWGNRSFFLYNDEEAVYVEGLALVLAEGLTAKKL